MRLDVLERLSLPVAAGALENDLQGLIEWEEAYRRRRRTVGRWWVFGGLVMALMVAAFLISIPMARAYRREQCHERLRCIGLAMFQYREEKGSLPAAAIVSEDGRPLLSWRVAILPYLGEQDLFNQFRFDEPWDGPHNRALLSKMPDLYACPSEPRSREGFTTYQVIVGPSGPLDGAKPLFERSRGVDIREVLDGTSNTLMVVETARPVPWTKPDDLYFEVDRPLPQFGSRHAGGYHGVFADGSIRFLKFTMSTQIRRSIVTRDGGEVISA